MGFGLDSLMPVAGSLVGGYLGGSQGASIGGTIGQGIGGSMAANQASQEQQDALNQAIAYNQSLYKSSLNQLAPYQAAGSTSMTALMGLLGLGGKYGTNLTNLQNSINAQPPQAAASSSSSPSMPWYQSLINAIDPGNISGHSSGGGIGSNILGNLFDPGNVVGLNPKGGSPNKATQIGGEAAAAYFGVPALKSLANNSGDTNGRMMGGPTQGGNQGKSFVVGEDGPEVLHMFPGAQGYVTPNPGTMQRVSGHRMMGGPVGGGMGNGFLGGGQMQGIMQGVNGSGTNSTMPWRASEGPGAGGAPAASAVPGTSGGGFNPYASNTKSTLSSGQTPAQLMAMDPSYQFQMQQGIQAMDHSAAAQGGLLTGGHLKDLMTFGQGLASQDFNNIYNRLMGVTSMGLGASSTAGQFGLFTGSNAGGLMAQAGQAGAQGGIAGFNAMSGSLGNLFSGAGSSFGNIFGGGGGSSGGITMPSGGFGDGQPGG